jgi:2-keto-4-pentenoate hydratase/2-oxohepta-3-ene-1,7-dioic acid hydratase in catechol pathway
MRFVVYDEWRVGILADDGVHDVSGLIQEPWRGTPRAMNWLVERFQEVRGALERMALEVPPVTLDGLRLRPPVPVPLHLMAAPSNNAAHVAEMRQRGHGSTLVATPREVGFFLEAPGSICGPGDPIELPAMPGRRFEHECELALVMGREARAVPAEAALDHVFGYTCLIDVTLRSGGGRQEERSMRKSFASFTPVGPTLVTADELPDPGSVGLRLWVNGDLRQDANTRDLIVGVPELIAIASRVLPLQPGDLYTTGSPAGVGPLEPGDVLESEMDVVGRMRLPVRARDW